MILDEVASGLDPQGRQAVEKALNNAMEGRTTLVVSHHDSLLSKCDKIFVLSDTGHVVEQGTYVDLSGDPESRYSKIGKVR